MLRVICKFQVDMPINARIIAVQTLENLHAFFIAAAMLDAHQPTIPYNKTEDFTTSSVHTSIFIGPNDFKFGTDIRYTVLQSISKFEGN